MRFKKGLRWVTAESGDEVIVPAGTSHRFANAGDRPARVRVEVRPALRMEELFETVAALAREGRTFPSGMPRPLELAMFMREFEREVKAPVAPGLVRAVMSPLVWIARRRGLQARYRAVPDLAARTSTPSRPGSPSTPGRRRGSTRPSPSRPGPSDRVRGVRSVGKRTE
jgi:hypothetical protein